MDSLSPFLQDSFIPYFMPVYPGAPLKSTGPRTPEGKAVVKNNAVKHGLTSREVFIGEDEVYDYEILLSEFIDNWSPSTQEEMSMVAHLRDLQWRLNSIPALHINLLTMATEEHLEQFEAYADNPKLQRSMARTAAYRANMRAFEQFSRHEGRLERSIDRLEKRLTEIIDARKERDRRLAQEAAGKQRLEEKQDGQKAGATKQSQPSKPYPAGQAALQNGQPDEIGGVDNEIAA